MSDPERSEYKDRIHAAAARLFSEGGYRSTSMRDIAAAMDLKAGSLYTHITSKEEVLWDIINRVADEFDEALRQATEPAGPGQAPPGTAAGRFRAALGAYVGVVSRNLDRATVLFTEWRQLPPERQALIAARRNAVEDVFRRLLDEGVQAGEFAPGTPVKLTAILALSGANWLPTWFRQGGALSAEQVADQFVDVVLRGIEPR